MSCFTSLDSIKKPFYSMNNILTELQEPVFISSEPIKKFASKFKKSRFGVCMKQYGKNIATIFTQSEHDTDVVSKVSYFSAPQTLYYMPENQNGKLKEESIEEIECPICRLTGKNDCFTEMMNCPHIVCNCCMVHYIILLMIDRTDWGLTCLCCDELFHPKDICNSFNSYMKGKFLDNIKLDYEVTEEFLQKMLDKFYKLSLNKALNKMSGMCWCPGPGCGYGVIGEKNSSCPKVKCMNEKCGIDFCTNCSSVCHPKVSCKKNSKRLAQIKRKAYSSKLRETEIKLCPGCQAPITRIMDDSCNEIQCSLCHTNFCWLCLKKTNGLHYLSLGRCTMWGYKRMRRKKLILYRCVAFTTAAIVIPVSAIFLSPFVAVYYPYSAIKLLNKRRNVQKNNQNNLLKFSVYSILVILSTPVVTAGIISVGACASLTYVYLALPIIVLNKKIKSTMEKIKASKSKPKIPSTISDDLLFSN